MKNFFRTVLALSIAAVTLAGCSNDEKPTSILSNGQSDVEYVKDKGTFVVGITDYAPMDFKDGDSWTGFDAELARKFADELGVTAEFVEIDWEKKTDLLTDGTIDCVWNGMTMTDELVQEIDCSEPYLSNSQVIVMPKDKMGQYETIEKCQHLLFAVEDGSSGQELLGVKYRYSVYDTQKDTLQSVADCKTDAAVIDIIMAGYYTADGNEFSQLGYQIPLDDEKICIGLRKGSDITQMVNDFLKELVSSGEMTEIADKYGISGAVLS